MAAVDGIVRLNIVQQTGAIPTSLTTIPLILGVTDPGWDADDFVHAYTSAADMLTDGFESTSPEYAYALILTSQTTVPGEFLVGRRQGAGTPAVAQVDKMTMQSVTANTLYKLSVNGKVYSYTSGGNDSVSTVLTGLGASIAADSAAPLTASLETGGGTLDLTAKVAGQALTYTNVDAGLTITNATASSTAQPSPLEVADLEAVQMQDDSWYGLLLPHATDADIEVAAEWIAPQHKFLWATVNDPDVAAGNNTSDILSTLAAKGYDNVAIVYSPANYAIGIEAGWVGGQLPQVPGSNTWMFKQIVGATPDKLSTQQVQTIAGIQVNGTAGKKGNVYTEVVKGIPMMQAGRAVSGQFIDITIGLDWLYFNLSSQLFGALQGATGKIPYTNGGVAILKGVLSAVLGQARDNGLLQPGFNVTAPDVSTVPQSQRANRVAPTLSFTATLNGAVHAVQVSGTVSV